MPNKYIFTSDSTFVNPYNFVPTNFTRKASTAQETAETFTGWLDCKLTARTPLAIPDTDPAVVTEDSEVTEHKHYPFFTVKNMSNESTPCIPGSSIRGVIRSIFETVTDSCYSTADADAHISYRAKAPFKAGLLYKTQEGDYFILPATRCVVNKNDTELRNLHYAQPVYFTTHEETHSIQAGRNMIQITLDVVDDGYSACAAEKSTGYVCIGEPFGNKKKYESFFRPNGDAQEIPVSEDILGAYLDALKLYCDPAVNRSGICEDFYKDRHDNKFTAKFFEVGKYYPIWYAYEQNGRSMSLRLSPAQIGRTETYKNTETLLGTRTPCTNKACACPACRLFGMVAEMDKKTGENQSIASRVRFSDAALLAGKVTKPVTLKELAGPHPSYMPFYAQGGLDYDKGATFRGRKFYWHNPAAANSDAPYKNTMNPAKTNRNATMELTETGSAFTFRVYYDRITADELQKLIWSLTLGENTADGSYCQKLGHGKPIGLGSVKITVTKNTQRTRENGYKLAEIPVEVTALQGATAQALLKICDFNAQAGQEVRYPYVETSPTYRPRNMNDTASHQWFTRNWKLGNNNVNYFPLPAVTDVQTLYAAVHKFDPLFNTIRIVNPPSNGVRSSGNSYGGNNNYSGGNRYGGGYGNNNYGGSRSGYGAPAPRQAPPAPAEAPIKNPGFCDRCGKPTKPDKDGNPRRYCGVCQGIVASEAAKNTRQEQHQNNKGKNRR